VHGNTFATERLRQSDTKSWS